MTLPFRCILIVALTFAPSPACAGSFATYHPDQYYFAQAVDAFQRGRAPEARRFLEQSARYGDKLAQFGLALMARDGVGGPADALEAYAWFDVAAERGYPMFLAEREAFWLALDPEAQARALELGARIRAGYGDEVAKPRLERLLRIGKSRQTGTRTGAGSAKTGVAQFDAAARAAFIAAFLSKANPGGAFSAEAQASAALSAFGVATAQAGQTGFASQGSYYDDANWEPALYWYLRDAPYLQGRVTVRPLRTAAAAPDDPE